MAANRLYPPLPSPSVSSVVLSSDEEDEDIIVDDDERPTILHAQDDAPAGGFCHTTISLNEFQDSITRQKQLASSSHTHPPNHKRDSYPYKAMGTWLWSVVCKWRYPLIGLFLAFLTIMYLGEIEHVKQGMQNTIT